MGADASTAHRVICDLFSTENLAGPSKSRETAEKNEAELGDQLIEDGFIFDLVDMIKRHMTLHSIPDPDDRTGEKKRATELIKQRTKMYLDEQGHSAKGKLQPHQEALLQKWSDFDFTLK